MLTFVFVQWNLSEANQCDVFGLWQAEQCKSQGVQAHTQPLEGVIFQKVHQKFRRFTNQTIPFLFSPEFC